MEPVEIVTSYLKSDGRCYGHCDSRTELKIVEKGDRVISCMTCPGGYVSRIVMYGRDIDAAAFKQYLTEKAGKLGGISDEDIRLATRHPWDLGMEGSEDVVIREAYWTQNYRRTKSEDPARNALFLCGECGDLYVSPLSAGGKHAH